LNAIETTQGIMQWIDTFSEWDRSFPVVMIGSDPGYEQRRNVFHTLVVKGLNLHPHVVEIEHDQDQPPVLVKPRGAGLYLSLSSRGGLAVYAAVKNPVGVDVETVNEEAEPPWNVLHDKERNYLEALSGRARAMAFTKIWTLKEAYLKALALGLSRDTRTFCALPHEEGGVIEDELSEVKIVQALTTWRTLHGQWAAVSLVSIKR
jgi:phosphopantetheinyl transferase